MEQTIAGLLLISILIGLPIFLHLAGPKATPSDKEVVAVKCSQCGATCLKILISKHC